MLHWIKTLFGIHWSKSELIINLEHYFTYSEQFRFENQVNSVILTR
jgi:hypothetical protein